ncbi:uncharacterized protein LOC103695815 isoform X2 [Phoenix dactylifera]|uniref:Uncharacterized protein LOC103695815 isoform X2 n=1 Tax=Phoenix dactylifera TaxID=42345 RepID=A0A8B9AET8_PHODC|nr:uncharacterized protein LOC103695815 isoform X2 [Phoenix dactylifera]
MAVYTSPSRGSHLLILVPWSVALADITVSFPPRNILRPFGIRRSSQRRSSRRLSSGSVLLHPCRHHRGRERRGGDENAVLLGGIFDIGNMCYMRSDLLMLLRESIGRASFAYFSSKCFYMLLWSLAIWRMGLSFIGISGVAVFHDIISSFGWEVVVLKLVDLSLSRGMQLWFLIKMKFCNLIFLQVT